MYSFRNSPLAENNQRGSGGSLWRLLIEFLAIYLLYSLAASTVVSTVVLIDSWQDLMPLFNRMFAGEAGATELLMETLNDAMMQRAGLLTQLFSNGLLILFTVLCVRLIDRRSPVSVGMTRRRAIPWFIAGIAAGALLMGVVIGICAATGAVRVTGFNGISAGFVLFFFAFLVQGTAEEVLVRGFLFTGSLRVLPLAGAAGLSSLLFALMHWGNAGVNVIGLVNLTLFGVFAALLSMRCGNIWLCCGLHASWNFVQGCVFGCPTSGVFLTDSLFTVELPAPRQLTNGGAFGPEGGIVVTQVLLLAVFALLYPPKKFMKPDKPQVSDAGGDQS